MNFEEILARIARGESVAPEEILPYLSLERRERRAEVNRLLAEAYERAGGAENLRLARVFIRRAWLFSQFSAALLPLYKRIHSALGDVEAVREAYKRVGAAMAEAGDVAEAIRHFDLWQYAYMEFESLDKFAFDFEVLRSMERLAERFRLPPKRRPADGKLRLAYLVKGITEPGSVLVRINLLFARFHDRARFEPIFFAPEPEGGVVEFEAGREHLEQFESYGCKVTMSPNVSSLEERLLSVARSIRDAEPDALVVSGALTQFQHYFINCLRPAPLVIGLVQGPPEQYAPPSLDWGIAWSLHPMLDSPVDCALTEMELDLPTREAVDARRRSELGIPEDAFVAATAGRYVKFQEPEFWRAIVEMLEEQPGMYYLALGVEEERIPFLPSLLTEGERKRIRFLKWGGADYLRSLSLADIFIDTYPSGGGAVLWDAVALGIPVVMFKNDYMRLYDQTDWSPAEESVHSPETLVGRGDFDAMRRVVRRLADDPEFLRDVARRSRERMLETRSQPARAVRRCEEIYERVIERELSGVATSDSFAPSARALEGLEERIVRRGHAPQWIRRGARRLKRALRYGERMLDRVADG